MTYLLALAAFAAVFAVYSTVTTVIVEGFNKLFGLRSAGMAEMMRAFYATRLQALQPDAPAPSPEPSAPQVPASSREARAFARTMTHDRAAESLRPWYIRRWPLLGALAGGQRQRMTTLEFIERLARTPEGAALAQHPPHLRREALSAAAYEFERLGDNQGALFRARAKVLSVLVGIGVACAINLDAIALYRGLVVHEATAARITLLGDDPAFARLAGGDAPEDGAVASLGEAQALITTLTGAGMPLGAAMYPYCSKAGEDRQDAAGDLVSQARDARCASRQREQVTALWQRADQANRAAAAEAQGAFAPLVQLGLRVQSAAGQVWTLAVVDGPRLALWALGVVIAGGLLGLGAPFWFNLFSRLASTASPAARAALAQASAATPAPEASLGVRARGASDPASLERGFLNGLGASPQTLAQAQFEPIPGREVGARPPLQPAR